MAIKKDSKPALFATSIEIQTHFQPLNATQRRPLPNDAIPFIT
jgi:hypothetical protein